MPSNTASIRTYLATSEETGKPVVFAQRLDAQGNAVGDPVQVSSDTVAATEIVSATVLPDGKFVVAYRFDDRPVMDPTDQHLATAEFRADDSLLKFTDFGQVDTPEERYIKITPVSDGTYAYILRHEVYDMDFVTVKQTVGFVDASGQARETFITENLYGGGGWNYQIYSTSNATVRPFADGKFFVSYTGKYSFLDPEDFDSPFYLNAIKLSERVFDGSGRLEAKISTSFGDTRTIERYDPSTGAETSATAVRTDGSRIDTQFGITGRAYVDQSIERNASGNIVEIKRHYGDAKHTLAFEQKFFADGTGEVHSYDTAGRETLRQIGNLAGEHDVTEFTYTGTGTAPTTTVLTHYDASNTRQYSDTTKADGTHLQQSFAAGVTLASHEGVADTFTAFKNGADTFVFAPAFGKDTIKGFQSGSDAGHDILQFDDQLLANASDLSSHLSQVGLDTLISFDDGSSVLLKNVAAASLTADNVQVVHHDMLMA